MGEATGAFWNLGLKTDDQLDSDLSLLSRSKPQTLQKDKPIVPN